MKLLRLRVCQVRQFRQPLEISDFSPGINLFVGPNESGKSTLVRAIRAAFFERHRSSSVDDLRPWGDSSAAPEVQLDFEQDGQRWNLAKRFLQQKRCDLMIDGQHFSGEDAEEKMAEVFGFQFPGRGASKAEHWGIPGLMWIEQGQGQEVRPAIAYASEHLKSALGSTLGEIASSAGDDIMRAVEEHRARYLTRTGRPTDDYAEAIGLQETLQASLKELDDKIEHYRGQVDRLAELRQLHDGEAAERPWEGLREQEREAREKFEQVRQLKEQQGQDTREAEECESRLALITTNLESFRKQAETLDAREKALAQASETHTTLNERLHAIEEKVALARTRYDGAREQEQRARQHAQRQSLQREIAQIQESARKLESNLEGARKFQAEMLELQRELAANSLEAKDLDRLRASTAELNELRIRQSSVATKLTYELLPERSISLDGEQLSGSGERLLLEPAELDITGIGVLRVMPGGEDIGVLVRKLRQAEDAATALMKELQVDSLVAAEARAEKCRGLQAALASHQKLIHSLAPEGIDVLAAELHRHHQRLQVSQAQLASLPQSDDAAMDASGAEQIREEAQEALQAAEREKAEFQRQLAIASQQRRHAHEELENLRGTLADPQREAQQKEYSQRLLETRARLHALHTRLSERGAQIESARPDILEQDIARFHASADQLEKSFRARQQELVALAAELGALGASGLEEERARMAGELEAASRRCRELERRAKAAAMLADLLREKRHALTRRLQAPLQKHINHYLRLLFSQASMDLDENLVPVKLLRPNTHGIEAGDFDALSFGAREQMGLISRLAYADLLQEAAKPTLIILDDALVHSDSQRLAQMKRVLFDAGQRHQILLFTCHPENWRDLGVRHRELGFARVAVGVTAESENSLADEQVEQD